MNAAAAKLLEKGHILVVGVNAALPIVARSTAVDSHTAIMDISLAVIDACEGLLLIGESPGANRERDLILSKDLPVFYHIDEVP